MSLMREREHALGHAEGAAAHRLGPGQEHSRAAAATACLAANAGAATTRGKLAATRFRQCRRPRGAGHGRRGAPASSHLPPNPAPATTPTPVAARAPRPGKVLVHAGGRIGLD